MNSVGSIGGYIGPDMIGRIRMATGGDSQTAFFVLAVAAFVGAFLTIATPASRQGKGPVRLVR